jgi:hypothetical protein
LSFLFFLPCFYSDMHNSYLRSWKGQTLTWRVSWYMDTCIDWAVYCIQHYILCVELQFTFDKDLVSKEDLAYIVKK